MALDLPTDGSAFVVFREAAETAVPHMERRHLGGEIFVPAPWHVTFAYHSGIASAPPAPVTLDRLVDFTTRDDLKYFGGTATYRARVTLDAGQKSNLRELSLGALPSGLASVKVNGEDCGVVWCAPWTADVKGALRAGENEIEVRYVNNWYNRLLGDCVLPPEKRVTKSVLRYWTEPRKTDPKRRWDTQPTVYSGYSVSDPLQPSGLLGPVELH